MKQHLALSSIVLGFALSACAAPNKVPTWAIHVERPAVEAAPNIANYRNKLVEELDQPTLASGHLSGDQIAALAVSELQAGRTVDAALLLAVASYRYHQQTARIVDLIPSGEEYLSGMERRGYRINREVYYAHVRHEIDVMRDMDFDDVLQAYSIWSDRGQLQAYLARKTLAQLDPARPSESRSALSRLKNQLDRISQGPPAPPRAHRISDAFRRRLEIDSADERHRVVSAWYLAVTPLPAYRDTAIEQSPLYFSGSTIRAFSQQPGELADRLEGLLASPRPETRSLAALIVAQKARFAAEENQTPADARGQAAIERAMGTEVDALVRMSMLQALVVLGDTGRLAELEQRIREVCPASEACFHGLVLIEWLPEAQPIGLEPGFLGQVARDPKADSAARLFAVRALGRLGRQNPLPEPALLALLQTADDRDNAELASTARAEVAGLPQLTSDEVAARLIKAPTGRSALLARIAEAGRESDLPTLARFQSHLWNMTTPEQHAYVAALAKLPGTKTDGLLAAAYDQLRDEPLRTQIAALISGESPRAPWLAQRIEAETRSAPSAILKARNGAPDARLAVAELLRVGSGFQRVLAINLVVGLRDTSQIPNLWTLASYRSDSEYPADAYVRRAALEALFILELEAAAGRFSKAKQREEALTPETRIGL